MATGTLTPLGVVEKSKLKHEKGKDTREKEAGWASSLVRMIDFFSKKSKNFIVISINSYKIKISP